MAAPSPQLLACTSLDTHYQFSARQKAMGRHDYISTNDYELDSGSVSCLLPPVSSRQLLPLCLTCAPVSADQDSIVPLQVVLLPAHAHLLEGGPN